MRRWAAPAVFLLMAAFVAGGAVGAARLAVRTPSLRHDLLLGYDVLRFAVAAAFAFFTLDRSEPVERSRQPVAWVACAAAMLTVGLVRTPHDGGSNALLMIGDLVALTACLWLLVSVLTLGRCFGVLPEARGLVCRGPYRFVRHPVYLGEILALTGLAVGAASVWNLTVLAIFVVAQFTRVSFEERALASAFPEYQDYAERTGRLIPQLRLFIPSRIESAQ